MADCDSSSPYLESGEIRFALLGHRSGIRARLVRNDDDKALLFGTLQEARDMQLQLGVAGVHTNVMYVFPMSCGNRLGVFWDDDCGHAFETLDANSVDLYTPAPAARNTGMGMVA